MPSPRSLSQNARLASLLGAAVLLGGGVLVAETPSVAAVAGTSTVFSTPGATTYEVPTGICGVTIAADGGHGGDGGSTSSPGGSHAHLTRTSPSARARPSTSWSAGRAAPAATTASPGRAWAGSVVAVVVPPAVAVAAPPWSGPGRIRWSWREPGAAAPAVM